MTNQKIHSLALMIGMAASVVTMSIHPTSIDLHAPAEAIARINHINIATHVLGLASIPVTVLGFFGISCRLGWKNLSGLSAFIIYCFAAVAIMLAAVADGLIAPSLVQEAINVDDSKRQMILMALHYNFQLNQALAKVYVVGSSCSFILWSLAIMRLGRIEAYLGSSGCLIGACGLLALLGGHIQMSAHGFGLIVLVQAIWSILLAYSMLTVRSARETVMPED
jgi:hypothetical protein